MGSWAALNINGHELLSWKNTYDRWYFTKADRVRDIVDEKNEYNSDNFIGYRTTVANLRRRLHLGGYNLKTVERDFNDTRSVWIENMRDMLEYYQGHKERKDEAFYSDMFNKISSQLEVIRTTSFQDWLKTVPRALAMSDSFAEKTMLGEDIVIENEPLLSIMLSQLPGVYDDNFGYAGSIFPCMYVESYAIVLLEMSDDNDICELDVSDLIHGGWVDDFEDIAQTQAGETIFYQHFKQSIDELSTLNNTSDQETLQRMIFASVITAMEAYLSDTMKKQVLNRHAIKRRFVECHNSFEAKIKQNGIFTLLDTLDQKLNEEIDKISFHNVDTVTGLYNNVLLCEFPKDKMSQLSKAVDIRHDIVHRNGKKTDGTLVVVSQQDVMNLVELIQYLIKDIDSQIIDGLLDDLEG
ncbi:HEPN/Toprim-associated domain-containing protein [Vibrio parahaemolyticus]